MMETADIFTFCQNDLQRTSFSTFEEMRRKGQFCDLTINVQNQSITAHRIVVAAGIPYFQSAFDCTDKDSEEKEIAVQDNIDPRALESLILFAYTSKVDITTENAQSLLVTAQFLEMDQIRDSCIKFLSKRLNVHNVVQIRELAHSLNNSRLIDNCNSYIRKNFEDFSRTLDFLHLSHACIKEILLDDDLTISSEEVAFEAMMQWVKYSPERQAALPDLLAQVRMIYLPVPYLMKQVDTEELIINSKPCKDLVNEIKYYHLLPEEFAEFRNLKTRPRNCFMQNLYAVCSYDVTDFDSRLFIFTSFREKWLTLSSMELQCSVHDVTAVDGKIYILLDETFLTFDPKNQKWKLLKQTQDCLEGAATAPHQKKIYCFGAEDERFADKMRVFDTQSNEWGKIKKMKTKRWDSAAAPLGEYIYVTGGYNIDTEEQMTSVEKYCPFRDKWTDVVPMLNRRDRHGCTSMSGKIYVCGGMETTASALNLMEVYDPLTVQWMSVRSMQNSKIILSLVPHCGRMYAFGGTDIELYDPENNQWTQSSFVPIRLRGAASILT